MTRNKSILLHRPTPWHSETTCSTKTLARHFKADCFDVAYMESPFDIAHILRRSGYYEVWKMSPRWEDGIWIMNPFSLVPVRDKFPLRTRLAASASYKSCIPSIRSLLRRGGFEEPDIIWSARPGSCVLKKMFPNSTLVMQVVDYYPAFRGDYIKEIEKYDYAVADHIFVVGYALLDYVANELGVEREKVTVLGQGVHTEVYEHTYECPEDIRNAPKPRAIWVGVLQKADSEMFRMTAEYMRSIGGSFILVGPESDWAVALRNEVGHVYVVGPKKPTKVPAYLKHCDIGVMLYDRNREGVYRGQNPLKLVEYAAAGLSIISTPHEEYNYLAPPIIIVSQVTDVPRALEKAICESKRYREKALLFAAKHTWKEVYHRARNVIVTLMD